MKRRIAKKMLQPETRGRLRLACWARLWSAARRHEAVRAIIDHPKWWPAHWRAKPDLLRPSEIVRAFDSCSDCRHRRGEGCSVRGTICWAGVALTPTRKTGVRGMMHHHIGGR